MSLKKIFPAILFLFTFLFLYGEQDKPGLSAHASNLLITTQITPENAETRPVIPAPTGVSAVPLSPRKLKISWGYGSDKIHNFNIWYKKGDAEYKKYSYSINSDLRSYIVTTDHKTHYSFKMTAEHSYHGPSDFSGEISLITPDDKPENLKAVSLSSTKTELTWQYSGDHKRGFHIWYKKGDEPYERYGNDISPDLRKFTLNTDYNTKYAFKVVAFRFEGIHYCHSSFSNEAKLTTPDDKPENLQAISLSSTKTELTWQYSGDYKQGFHIWYKKGDEPYEKYGNSISPDLKKFTFKTDYNTAYAFKVVAYGHNYEYSNYSNEIKLTTPDDKPEALQAKVLSSTKTELTWQYQGDYQDGFDIWYKKEGSTFKKYGYTISADTRKYKVTIDHNQTYTFKMVAKRLIGHYYHYSNYSNQVTLTTPDDRVVNLKAKALPEGQVLLTWQYQGDYNDSFEVWYRKNGNEYKKKWYDVDGSDRQTIYKGSCNSHYIFKIRASDGNNCSGFSNEVEITTVDEVPYKPSSLKAVTVTEKKVELSWKDRSDNEDGFEIYRRAVGHQSDAVPVGKVAANTTQWQDLKPECGMQYYYQVCAFNNGGKSGFSNSVKVKIPSAIEVIQPTCGSTWKIGTRQTIKWTKEAGIGPVNIELYHKDTLIYKIASSIVEDSYSLRVFYALAEGKDYRIKVYSTADPALYGMSEYFSVKAFQQDLVINQPAGNTIWQLTQKEKISWIKDPSTDITENRQIKVFLYNHLTGIDTEMGDCYLEDLELFWTVPAAIGAGDHYFIVIKDFETGKLYAFSENFTISYPLIQITAPSAQTKWEIGKTQTIQFAAPAFVETLNIDLYQGEEFVSNLAKAVPAAPGSFAIIPETSLQEGEDYSVKLTNAVLPDHFVKSEPFSIIIGKPAFTKLSIEPELAEHWLANTGQQLPIKKIILKATENTGASTVLSPIYNKIRLLAPDDPNYATNDSGSNNVHRNKGLCEYRIYALDRENNREYWLAEFSRDALGAGQQFKITYNPDYFDQKGDKLINSQYRLQTDLSGHLRWLNPAISLDTGNFGLKIVENSGPIRPGDDLLLKFGLQRWHTVTGTAPEGGFIAVYDKKLLDEARKYIENGEDTIRSWRKFDDNTLVDNSVAYGWGCWDTVAQFNNGVQTQQDMDKWSDYNMPAFTVVKYEGINYYKPTNNEKIVPGFSSYARFDNTNSQLVFLDANGNPLDPDGGVLDTTNTSDGVAHNYSWRLNQITAGIDCSGLVSRVSNYDNCPYVIADGTKKNTTMLANNDNSWMIDDYKNLNDNDNRNLLVPGDILVREGKHVAIILRIDYANNSRIVLLKNVTVIEAAEGNDQEWRVINTRTWQRLEQIQAYHAKRLRIN